MREVVLSFQAITATADGSGDYSESAATAVTVRGTISQLDGRKLLAYTELIGMEVYEFICFDNSVLTLASTCAWGSKVLHIHKVIENYDERFTNKVKLILYAK